MFGKGWGACLAVALLLVHAELVLYSGVVHTPNYDEVGHLPAGMMVVQQGRCDLYRVNPPLIKAIAALPVSLAGYDVSHLRYDTDVTRRPEWSTGKHWISTLNDPDLSPWLYGRLAQGDCATMGNL